MTENNTTKAGFLSGDGKAADLIARHDWSSTLGPIESWPQSLKTTVGLMLHSPVPLVLLWGPDGIMIYNDAYSVFAGNRHPRLLGSKVLEGWPEAADLNALVMRTGLAGDNLSYKDRELSLNRRGTFEPCWVDLDYSPVIDESGKPGGVIAVVVETTERVLAERVAQAEREALRDSQERLQMALSAGNGVGTWDWDVPNDRVVADARFAALYGVDPAKARLGAPIADFFAGMHPDDLTRVEARVAEVVRNGDVFEEQYRLVQSDGSVRWVAAEGRCILAADGTPLRFPGVSFDITARKVTEDALRQNSARLAFLDELNRKTATSRDADAILATTTRMVGEYLAVSICAYADMDPDQDGFTIRGEWSAPGSPSILGHYSLADFGRKAVAELGAGRPLILHDTRQELAPNEAATFHAIGVGATICMPLVKEDRLTALMAIHHKRPHQWTEEELALIREVTERSWAHIERVRDEAARRDAAERLHLAANAAGIGTFDYNPLTGALRWDERCKALFGLPPDAEVTYDTFLAGLHPDDRAAIDRTVQKSFDPDGSGNYDVEYRTIGLEDGVERWIAATGHVFFENRQPVRFVGTVLDISTQKRAEARLRASEAQFRTMAQAVPNHVWTAPPDGLLNWFNQQVYDYSGAQYGSLDGTGWVAIVHPDDVTNAGGRWAKALETGTSYETEFRLRRHDGQWRWHIARAVPIKDAEGILTSWVGTNTDIHDQKESVDALRELNATLERRVIERTQARGMTWQLSPDLMGALNSKGYFETSNPAWQSMLGWSEAEVASMSIFELLHPDDVERTKAGFELTQIGQPSIQFPNRYRQKDGDYRWISWVAVPEDGMVYCSGRDITADKQQEAELLQAQDALRQAQKMEAVGQLTGGIAHDFNNLLQGITGALDRVQHRIAGGRPAEAERFVKAAMEAATRAASLTHRLLAFSRRQTLDPKPVDPNRLIAGMEDMINRAMGPNFSVEVVGAAGVWPIRVDPSQLENSLLNLCINARDAMPGGGKLTIETANKWLDDRAARERELPPGQYVSVCVTDTGTGMTPEVIARAFDPFFTTKPLGQGTGLGLSMIYGFVRQSGGQVRIYSEIDKGTTMCLYFPRHQGAVEDEAEHAHEMMERGFGETVLVVDDEATVRMLIAEVLGESFYNILEAGDGPSALKVLELDKRIDLMITDVGLPGGMNGRQIADAARVLRKDLKVLFITGYAENAVVGNGHLEPGMQILAKPFAMSTLANKVREMIES